MPSSDGRTDAAARRRRARRRRSTRRCSTSAARRVRRARAARRRAAPGPSSDRYDVDAHHALAREAAGRGDRAAEERRGVLPLAAGRSRRRHRRVRRASRATRAPDLADQPDAARQRARRDPRARGRRRSPFARRLHGSTVWPTSRGARRRGRGRGIALPTTPSWCSSACPARTSPRASTATTSTCRPSSSRCSRPCSPRTRARSSCSSNGGVVALPVRRARAGDPRGLAARPGRRRRDRRRAATARSTRRAELAETIPLRLEDTPAFLDFPGESRHVRYGEGLFVGYRWYDARALEVAFPFGHGLSYTTFAYADAAAAADATATSTVRVTVDEHRRPRRPRGRAGLHVARRSARAARPARAQGLRSVALDAGERREVELTVRREDLAYWDIRVDRWVVEGGEYSVEVARRAATSARPSRSTVEGDASPCRCRATSSIGEVHGAPGRRADGAGRDGPDDRRLGQGPRSIMPEGVDASKMMESFPIGRARPVSRAFPWLRPGHPRHPGRRRSAAG